jgi:hypothetical protein
MLDGPSRGRDRRVMSREPIEDWHSTTKMCQTILLYLADVVGRRRSETRCQSQLVWASSLGYHCPGQLFCDHER